MDESEKRECLFTNLRNLLQENCNNGIWFSNLIEKYEERFGFPLEPLEYGFEGLNDLVENSSFIRVVDCVAEGDYLLFSGDGFEEATRNDGDGETHVPRSVSEEEMRIPGSVIRELKKLLAQNARGIFTNDLLKEYRRVYQKQFLIADLGFSNLDSFFQYLEYYYQEFSFRQVDQNYVIVLNNASLDDESPPKKYDTTEDTTLFEPIPPEVCDGDIRLESDPLFDNVKSGDRFEVDLAEVFGPDKFYLTHVSRVKLLKNMMADIDQLYKSYEKNYKILNQLVSRGLLCACLFSNNTTDPVWHRVRVTRIDRSSEEAEVLYVDYGTTEKLSLQKLRFLHRDYAKHPALCVRARLAGVKPKDGSDFTKEINKKFYRLICNCELEVEVVKAFSTSSRCIDVLLYGFKNGVKINIAEELIERDLAEQIEISQDVPNMSKNFSGNHTSSKLFNLSEDKKSEYIPILESDGTDFKVLRGENSPVPSSTPIDVSEECNKTVTRKPETFFYGDKSNSYSPDFMLPNERLYRPADIVIPSEQKVLEKLPSGSSMFPPPPSAVSEKPPEFPPGPSMFPPPPSAVSEKPLEFPPGPPMFPPPPSAVFEKPPEFLPGPSLFPASSSAFPGKIPEFLQSSMFLPPPLAPPAERFNVTNFSYPPPSTIYNIFPMMPPNFPPPNYACYPPTFANVYPNFSAPYSSQPPLHQDSPVSIRPPPGFAPIATWPSPSPFSLSTKANDSYRNTFSPFMKHPTSESKISENMSSLYEDIHHLNDHGVGNDSCRCKFHSSSIYEKSIPTKSAFSGARKMKDDQEISLEKFYEKFRLKTSTGKIHSFPEENISCGRNSEKSNVVVNEKRPFQHLAISKLEKPTLSKYASSYSRKKNDGNGKAFFEMPLFAQNMHCISDKESMNSNEFSKFDSFVRTSCSFPKPNIKKEDNISSHTRIFKKLSSESSAEEEEEEENTSCSPIIETNKKIALKKSAKLKKILRITENNEDSEDSAYSTIRGGTPESFETDGDFFVGRTSNLRKVRKHSKLLTPKREDRANIEDEFEILSVQTSPNVPASSTPKTDDDNRKPFSSIRAFVLQEAQKVSPSKE